jgi:TPR repeat protein
LYCEKGTPRLMSLFARSLTVGSAAQGGYAEAMINLGHQYMNGVGVAKDCKKAEEWHLEGEKSLVSHH